MTTTRCSVCAAVVPETRFCLNCHAALDAAGVPDRRPSPTDHLSEITAGADHPSVTFETLRSKHDRYDRPLGGYLFEGERPRLVLDVDEVTVDAYDGETWTINPGFRKRGHAIVTDRRVVVVSPSNRGDQVAEFRFADVVGVETESSWLSEALTLELADGSSATLSVAGFDGDLAAAADRMRELAHSDHSPESRTAAFVRDVDAVVADATDAETALRGAADLFAERDEESVFDRFVAEADSAEELFALLSESALVGPSTPKRPASGGGGSAGAAGGAAEQLPTPRLNRLAARPIGRNLKRAFREGDPKEAGKWAIGVGIAGFGVAASLPFSTAAGLGALALGGAATGAYASANPDSAAARIDPLEMALGARTRGRRWEREGGPGGAAVGNVLGAAEHVVDRTNSEAYAHWYANVDPESVLRGAELGARAADSSPEFGNRTAGALLGGGFGLAYGYSGLDVEEDLDELLDEDLRSVLPPEVTDNSPGPSVPDSVEAAGRVEGESDAGDADEDAFVDADVRPVDAADGTDGADGAETADADVESADADGGDAGTGDEGVEGGADADAEGE